MGLRDPDEQPYRYSDEAVAELRARAEKAEALIAQTLQLATIPKDAILSPMRLLDLYGLAINYLRCNAS